MQQTNITKGGQDIIKIWKTLTEEEKSKLLPNLLITMKGWRDWTFSPYSFLAWLEWKFKQVGIPFPKELQQ